MCDHHDHFAGLDNDLSDEGVEAAPLSVEDMRGRFTDALKATQFMMAGKAIVTLVSARTGNRFTYQITKSKDGACHFVGLLVGSDNNSNYKYIGRISRAVFWAGRKFPREGDIAKDAPSVKAFAWAWQNLIRNTVPAELEIWHEGSCGRCGRRLTVPSSIEQGFGPECINHVMGGAR